MWAKDMMQMILPPVDNDLSWLMACRPYTPNLITFSLKTMLVP
jgi:hypothetical protein